MRLARWLSVLRALLRRSRMERDMDAELQFHLDARTDDLVAAGAAPDDARRRAREEFGDALRWKEEGREARGVAMLDALQADLRYGFRWLRRSPGFAATVVLSMAIGIGANTAIFGVSNAVLLRRLAVRDPGALVLFAVSSDESGLGSSFPYPFYRMLRDSDDVLSGAVASASMSPSVEANGPAERLGGELVSGNYFDVLGVAPHLGRFFTAEDERAANHVVVLSYGFWQRRFGGDPSAVGRTIGLNGLAMTIVGVTPPAFHGIEPGASPSLRVPITLQAAMHGGASRLERSGEWWLQIVGRLKPGVTRTQAAGVLDRRYESFRAQFPNQQDAPERLELLDGSRGRPTLRRQFGLPLLILTALVATVLALVCVNVGSLMLARSTARRREMSLRLALGAARLRVVRQLLVEAVLLAAAGGAIGLLIARWGVSVLMRLADAPPEIEVPTDARVLAFATLATLVAGVLCGLAPAWASARVDLVSALKIESAQSTAVRTLGRRLLVAGQIALSLALLVGAGLLARTLFNLRHAGFGFQTERLALATVSPGLAGYSKDRLPLFYDEVLTRVSALPTVDSAAFAVMPLLAGDMWGSGLTLDTGQHDDKPGPTRNAVGPGFFRTTGLPLAVGREFTSSDVAGGEPVAIVNEAFVRRYFDGGPAIGRRIGPGGPRGTARYTIVGVTRDSKIAHVREAPVCFWYVPYAQLGSHDQLTLHVRATGSPDAALSDVRQAVASLDPRVTVFEAATMRQQIEDQLLAERLLAILAGAFAVLAAGLASLGLFGVINYTTAARTREIGVRMALGASPGAILRLVLGQSLPMIAAGALTGVAIAAAAATRLQPLLFGLEPSDPPTVIAALVVTLVVTTAAAMLPARRAARINPAATLQ